MSEGLTTRLPLDHCPRCEQKLDAATSLDFKTPMPGDLSVCIHCAAVLQWSPIMRLEVADLRTVPVEALQKVAAFVAAARYVTPRARHQRN